MEKKSFKEKIICFFKPFILWLLVLLYLEGVFGLIIFESYMRDSLLNILLYSILIASFLSIITNIFNKKTNRVIVSIILGLLGFMFSLQVVFYRSYKTFFSFSVLSLADQLKSFLSETFKAIFVNLPFILLLMAPFILYLIFKKKIKLQRNNLGNYITSLILLVTSLSLIILKVNLSKKKDNSMYTLYHDINEISLNIEKMGLLSAYNLDIYRAINGFESKIIAVNEEEIKENSDDIFTYDKNTLELNFDKATSNNDIKTINSYMKSDSGTDQNRYTGIFKGYNVIYITAESFSEIGVSEKLTPTLYKLVHSGFDFTNFYTPNNLSTIGGEFQSLTGLFADNSILSKWRSGNNYFPYGLATMFKNAGYNTYAYHNNWYGFQDRHKYLKSQGFTNYLGCYNGLEKRMNCKAWPQSDDEMIRVTIGDYVNSDKPFLAYYMTVSGHFEYSFNANNMAKKHKNEVSGLNVSTAAKAYQATQIELDKALERLITELEKAGKLDKTIIVLLADHYPYELSMNDVNSLSTYNRDSVVEVNHNNLIIWNSRLKNIKVDKTCMSIDVLPTVYNLLGMPYDSRLLVGNDIFSNKEGLAIFKNRSWKTDYGTYYANNSKFVNTKEVSSDYVSNMNKIVNNRVNVSKLIVKSDYYKYLLK